MPLTSLIRGRPAAVQFMFTSCRTACPLLGNLFHSVEKRLGPGNSGAMLLSISIDPEHDGPADLKGWLAKHQAGPRWQAVTVQPAQTKALLAAFGLEEVPRVAHTTQVFYVSSKGLILGRTTPLPEAAAVAAELRRAP